MLFLLALADLKIAIIRQKKSSIVFFKPSKFQLSFLSFFLSFYCGRQALDVSRSTFAGEVECEALKSEVFQWITKWWTEKLHFSVLSTPQNRQRKTGKRPKTGNHCKMTRKNSKKDSWNLMGEEEYNKETKFWRIQCFPMQIGQIRSDQNWVFYLKIP